MQNNIGIMQGRLLPKYQNRYQAHPLGYWQEEFPIAKQLGLNLIEFIFDFNDFELNPLMNADGLTEILELSEKYKIQVRTVCADYFMEAPIHSDDISIVEHSQKVLKRLLDAGRELELSDIVIPCVDRASIQSSTSQVRFYENLSVCLDQAIRYNINLSLETDLPPEPFAELIHRFDCEVVTVNYDTGNSAALGYDPGEELGCYGKKISDIHIKDRLLNGGPVELGKGQAQFHKFFNALSEMDYKGPFVMQAYRDDEGVQIFKKQLQWLKDEFLSR